MLSGVVFFLKKVQSMLDEEKARSRSPFKERLMRSPGEGLMTRIEKTRDELIERIVILAVTVVAPGAVVIGCSVSDSRSGLLIAGLFILTAIVVWLYQWPKVRALREKLRNYRLAFDGERYVAEKLGVLVADGYRVFHDFLFTMKPGGAATDFNIDHILIGPTGVFAIETKTYRQPLREGTGWENNHKVRISGEELIFPKGRRTAEPIRQARRAAEDLSKLLTGSSTKVIPVIPIVAMPGWFVENDGVGDVRVVSAKALPKRIPYLGERGALSREEVRSISDRIEVHCRDVEGSA